MTACDREDCLKHRQDLARIRPVVEFVMRMNPNQGLTINALQNLQYIALKALSGHVGETNETLASAD